jgi:cytochrome c oxidase subunit 2
MMLLVACAKGALRPGGPQAAEIAQLYWLHYWVVTVIFVLVMAALAVALLRKRTDVPERSLDRGVIGTAVGSVIILFVLLIATVRSGNALSSMRTVDALPIEIVGHQWWWEVVYPGKDPTERFSTANEIHVPVGRPVRLRLESRDVIHSFWVPELHGKMDLIPSRTNTLVLQVDEPGIYRGRCAEFCGVQHAKMGFLVIAEKQEDFDLWAAAQLTPAPAPTTTSEQRGQVVFVNGPCATCHNVTGTPATGERGPDLTHVASRTTLAAASVPNVPGHMAGWITDNQSIKPGNQMPDVVLPSQDLLDLLSYLRSLR